MQLGLWDLEVFTCWDISMAKETYPECDFCYYNLEFHNEISFLMYLEGAPQAQPKVKQTNKSNSVWIYNQMAI